MALSRKPIFYIPNFEASKKKSDYLTSGSLLFHNWQDAHYNIKLPEYTRGFHIELNAEWFKRNDIHSLNFEGSTIIKNPQIQTKNKGLMKLNFKFKNFLKTINNFY